MFSEVYWHHAVRSASAMFARAFFEVHAEMDLAAFFRMSEADARDAIRARCAGTEAERLTEGLFGSRRLLYKRAGEFSSFQHPETYRLLARRPFPELAATAGRLAEWLTAELRQDVAATDVLIDAPPPSREVQFRVPIYYAKENVYRPLADVSPVVASLAREQFDDFVKRVRVFVHPRLRAAVLSLPDLPALLREVA
jgi:HD superfamily phosphohydrolase